MKVLAIILVTRDVMELDADRAIQACPSRRCRGIPKELRSRKMSWFFFSGEEAVPMAQLVGWLNF